MTNMNDLRQALENMIVRVKHARKRHLSGSFSVLSAIVPIVTFFISKCFNPFPNDKFYT